jgi:hypothetical protein
MKPTISPEPWDHAASPAVVTGFELESGLTNLWCVNLLACSARETGKEGRKEPMSRTMSLLRRIKLQKIYFGNLDLTSEANERKEMAYSDAEQITNDEVKHAWSQSQRIQAT